MNTLKNGDNAVVVDDVVGLDEDQKKYLGTIVTIDQDPDIDGIPWCKTFDGERHSFSVKKLRKQVTNKMYLVQRLMKEIFLGGGCKINLKTDDGMIGALAVYETEKQAEVYANGAGIAMIEFPDVANDVSDKQNREKQ